MELLIKKPYVMYKCSCGNTIVVNLCSLRSGTRKVVDVFAQNYYQNEIIDMDLDILQCMQFGNP